MRVWRICLIIAVLDCHFSVISATERKKDNEDSTSEKFKPTREWQSIKEGQAIPQGLHVRVNLQTGKKEAKLLEEPEDKRTAVSVASNEDQDMKPESSDHARVFRESLLNIDDSEAIQDENIAEQVREKFRSYKELKEAFNKLNMTVKTDLQIVAELLSKFKSIKLNTSVLLKEKEQKKEKDEDIDGNTNEVLNILTDLEYLVHQYDNALEFVRLGGISDVVNPLLNSTESIFRSKAAHLIGSAAQSNVKVQIAALENGVLISLLQAVALDTNTIVKLRSLYALSCLIRNFPVAQSKFVKEGGLSVLSKLFETEGHGAEKLQLKTITLLTDLISERQDALSILTENISNEEIRMKVQQYKKVGLENQIVEHGLCTKISDLLLVQNVNWGRTRRRDDISSAMTDLPVRPEHDVVEKVTSAMLALGDICHEEFYKDKELKDMINGLRKWYSDLAIKEDINKQLKYKNKDEMPTSEDQETESYFYYSGLSAILEKLNIKIFKNRTKDEL